MNPPRRSLGAEVEEWLRDFSRATGILSKKEFALEKMLQQMDNLLQRRLAMGRLFIANDLPYAQEWIDRILSGKVLPPSASDEAKAELTARLLDYVLATDILVSLKNNAGREYLIAIDVTCDRTKETEKLNCIQGKREDGDPARFNRNANLPVVRKALGIDKHLVLVVDHENLPEHETLLNELYQFANSNARTKLINLFNVERQVVQANIEKTSVNEPSSSAAHQTSSTAINLSELIRSINALLQLEGQPTQAGGYSFEIPDSSWRFEKEESVLLISHNEEAILIDDKNLTKAELSPSERSYLLKVQSAVDAHLRRIERKSQSKELEL